MLIQFRFKNHKCFYDESILDFTATQEKRHLDTTFDINGIKLLPFVAIHGANASGKSTVLDALNFMCSVITNSSNIDVNNDLITYPFAFCNKNQEANSEYELSILLNEYEYRYGFVINSQGFSEEWLYKKKFAAKTRAKQTLVFERINNQETFGPSFNKYEVTWNLFKNETDSSKLLILSNVARKEENGLFRDLYDYVSKFIFKAENISQRQSIELLTTDNALFKEFNDIINDFDPCLLGINIVPLENENGQKIFKISGIHKNIDNGQQNLLPLQNESYGTIKIFNILPAILRNLENGGVIFVDEIDTRLHPLLFKKIVSMYKDKQINKHQAQLIFTAHSTFLFNSEDIRRDEAYLVEKNSLGQSKLYSLCEFRNVRVDANYEKKYLEGSFGAIPFIS